MTTTVTTELDRGYRYVDWKPDDWFTDTTSGPYERMLTKSKTGVSLPNWRYLVRHNLNATNPYAVSTDSSGLIRGSVSFSIRNVNKGGRVDHCRIHGVLHPFDLIYGNPPSTSNADSQARIGFLKKVRKSQRSFQSGVFLGELGEALHQIARPASALRAAVSTYSSAAKKAARRARTPRQAAKAITGTWLEHSFGWVPLFNDVDDSMKALAGFREYIGDVFKYTFYDTSREGQKQSIQVPGTSVNLLFNWSVERGVRVTYKGMLAYEFANKAKDWKSNWGLTLSDFLPTIWELIPYSFLVDYFTNLGDVIDSACMGDVGLRWGVCSTKSWTAIHLADFQVESAWPAIWGYQPGTRVALVPTIGRTNFSRVPVTSVSTNIMDVRTEIPGLTSWRKWANMSALAVEKVL
jgi:hypothetical protein